MAIDNPAADAAYGPGVARAAEVGGPGHAAAAAGAERAGPRVRLVNGFAQPFDNAVATARTCYSPRIVDVADVAVDERRRVQRDAIAKSTYVAGHHTTLQHATFQFAIDNVSRQALWSFLHAHPFYNSEQVSQRYVAVRPERVYVPVLSPEARAIYHTCVAAQMACYRALCALLNEPATTAYFQIFPVRKKNAAAWAKAISKRTQEAARYCLPVATFAHLYHTVSGLTLHRYHRMSQTFDVPDEVYALVRAMVDAVDAWDPLFFRHIEDPIPLQDTPEYAALQRLGQHGGINPHARAFCRAFDAELGDRRSRLVTHDPAAEATMARAVRHVLGAMPAQLTDAEAVQMVMSPRQNLARAGALNLSSLGKLSRAMVHVAYTFQKKLSHAADSQDQRHRLTPATRPILHTHYVPGSPDVVVPELIAESPAALDRFMACMRATWYAIDGLLDAGVAPPTAMYLLPNAFPIRFDESGDLMGWQHKWTGRLCLNAQEEIWRASVDEVLAVRAVHPQIGATLMPPCGVRHAAGLRPICPEGPRYCGVPLWKQDVTAHARVI